MKKAVIIGGGFYLRAFPYYLTKGRIRALNKKGMPAMVYLHPHELFNSCYKHRLSLRENFVLNFKKNTFSNKIKRLFSDFEFSPIREILRLS